MRYVKLLVPLLIENINHPAEAVVLVNDERGADLIRTRFAVASGPPEVLANPDVNRLQDAIDPMPPPTYAPLSEDGLTVHPARVIAQVTDDATGTIALRTAIQESPNHTATGQQVDAVAKVEASKPAEVPPARDTSAAPPLKSEKSKPVVK